MDRDNTLVTSAQVTDAALRPFLGFNIKRAWNVINSDLMVTLEPYGLRIITYSALSMIGDNPGLSQAQLAQVLVVERPNLVAVTDELSAKGLVTRDRVPTDRRAYALRLTTEGARLLAQATEAVFAHEAALYQGLSEDERKALLAALRKIENTGTGRS